MCYKLVPLLEQYLLQLPFLALFVIRLLKFSLVHYGIEHLVPCSRVFEKVARSISVSVKLGIPLASCPFCLLFISISKYQNHCTTACYICQLFRYGTNNFIQIHLKKAFLALQTSFFFFFLLISFSKIALFLACVTNVGLVL